MVEEQGGAHFPGALLLLEQEAPPQAPSTAERGHAAAVALQAAAAVALQAAHAHAAAVAHAHAAAVAHERI